MRSIVSPATAALFLCLLNPSTLGAPTLAAAFVPGIEGGGRGEGGKCRALALLTKLSVGCTYLDSLSGSSSGNESGYTSHVQSLRPHKTGSGPGPASYLDALSAYSSYLDGLRPPKVVGASIRANYLNGLSNGEALVLDYFPKAPSLSSVAATSYEDSL